MRRLAFLLALLAGGAAAQAPQPGFGAFNGRNHPELDWQVAETEHFEIIYPARLAGIEDDAAPIVEQTYAALQANLGPVDFPDPIRVYLSDEDEIVNGIAMPLHRVGSTTIWVHANEFADVWTGDVKWLRKVVAHEIAHLFHFRIVRSNVGLLQELFAEAMPSFWAEGLAQYETELWDASRGDRVLRAAVFDDRLSYTDGLSPTNGRLRYAVGNSQIRFLAERDGDSTIVEILRHRRPALFGLARVNDFRAAFRAVTGQSYTAFYDEWRKHVNVYYNTVAGQMERLDSLGVDPLRMPGQAIQEVRFSPDTSRIAAVVLSSLRRPVRALYVMNNPGADSTDRRELRVLDEGAFVGPIDWSPDGTRVAYARSVRGPAGGLVADLYVADADRGRGRRLTRGRRARSPTWAPDGRRLAFVSARGPSASLAVLDTETGEEAPLAEFGRDVQVTSARWSPDGARIAVALFDDERRRGLALVDPETGAVTRLGTDDATPPAERDDRGPVWNAASDALAFTSLRDRTANVFAVGVGDAGGERVAGDGVAGDGGERAKGEGGEAAAPSSNAGPPVVQIRPGRSRAPEDSARASASSPTVSLPPPHSPRPTRLTYLYNGATVVDWLPPSEGHPEGRLVLLATETKRRDRVVVVDARRRPTVDPAPLRVPAAYAAWTTHRPPEEVAFDIPPDGSLVRARRPYNALANLGHSLSFGLPYGDPGENGRLFDGDDDWGAFGLSMWLEPLGKHALFLLGGVSVTRPADRSFAYVSYTNRTLAPTITVDAYRFPGPTSLYADDVLVENLTGGEVTATLPVDGLTDRAYAGVFASARTRLAYAEPYGLDRFEELDAEGGPLPLPTTGTRADVQLGLAYRWQRPYVLNTIHPLDGTGLRLRATAGVPVLGANAFVQPDVSAFHVARAPLGGRFFVYGRATALVGDPQLPQDVVGLARFDDVDLQLPFVGALSLDDAERVRGYRRYAIGEAVAFGTAEYRFEPWFDLKTNLLGVARLREVAPSLFVDAAAVWNGALDAPITRLGTGVELRNRASLAGVSLLHSVGVGVPAERLDRLWDGSIVWDDVDLYYRIQAALPF